MSDSIEDNITWNNPLQVHVHDNYFDPRDRGASNLMDASTFLLIGLNAPDQVRRIFPGLLGMLAGRSTKVTFTRLDLGRRLFRGGYVEEIERERIKQKMTDYLGAMQDWIHRENLEEVVRYSPGSKTEASIIQTPILRWIVEVADKAGQRLSGTEPDLVRRQVFEGEVKSLLNRKRIGTKRRRESTRRKRTADPSVHLKTAKSFLKLYFESAKVENDAEQVKANILREIAGFIDRIPTEISGEYLTVDDRKPSGTQRGDDQYLTRFDPTEGTCRVKFQSDDWETINEIGEAARGEVDATLEDRVLVDIPPCVPSSGSDADNLISDGAKAITAITASRQGDHWQAIRLAASVGAVPVRYILGGTGDASATQTDVRNVHDVPSWITGFDDLVRQSTDSQRSLILSLSPCVFHRDDCTSGDVERLSPFSWMITETSSGSYQVWFRLADAESGSDGRRRFHDILTAAGIGGNTGGTHSGRWPGTVNGKAKHQGWRVRLTGGQAGRFVTLGQMVDAFPSLNPLVEVKTTPRDNRSTMISESKSGYRGAMPDYDKCLIGRRSRSEADASFIKLAFERGFDADEIYTGLVAVSERASSMTESAVHADIKRVRAKYVH